MLKDYWHCRIIRSSIARGKIRTILLDTQFGSTGAILIQHKDIPAVFSIFGESMPLLSEEDIRYCGQPIALLLAESEEVLDSCEEMIQIRYKELSPLPIDPGKAAEVIYECTKVQGSPEQAWKGLSARFDGEWTIGTETDLGREQIYSVASWEGKAGSGRELKITAPIIWPHLIADNLAGIIPREKLHIVSENPGISYDYLLIDGSLIAIYSALAAWLSKKNVLLSYSPREQLLYGAGQPIVHLRHRSGLDKKHNLKVCDVMVNVNTGAFSLFTSEVVNQILGGVIGFYAIPHWRIRIRIYCSNLPPMTISHGFLAPLVQIPLETQINHLVEEVGESPLVWRQNHHLKKGDSIPPGWKAHEDIDSRNLLRNLNQISDYERKHSAYELLRKRRPPRDKSQGLNIRDSYQGIGITLGFQPSGFSRSIEKSIKSRVRVELRSDGYLHAYVNILTNTMNLFLRQIVKEELDMEGDKVLFHVLDCRDVPDSGPVCLSRSLTVVSDTFRKACIKLHKQRFHKALPISAETSFSVARSWDSKTLSGNPYIYRSFAAVTLELELDPVSFIPHIRTIWMVVDTPSFYNRRYACSALEGSIMKCIDWITGHPVQVEQVEQVEQIRGTQPYIPREARATPHIEIEFVGSPTDRKKGDNRNGFRDIPFALIPSAYLSALNQASGGRFNTVPCNSQVIFSQLVGEKGGANEN